MWALLSEMSPKRVAELVPNTFWGVMGRKIASFLVQESQVSEQLILLITWYLVDSLRAPTDFEDRFYTLYSSLVDKLMFLGEGITNKLYYLSVKLVPIFSIVERGFKARTSNRVLYLTHDKTRQLLESNDEIIDVFS
jgi:hypothetical protein